jgi:hypothetical protein
MKISRTGVKEIAVKKETGDNSRKEQERCLELKWF